MEVLGARVLEWVTLNGQVHECPLWGHSLARSRQRLCLWPRGRCCMWAGCQSDWTLATYQLVLGKAAGAS